MVCPYRLMPAGIERPIQSCIIATENGPPLTFRGWEPHVGANTEVAKKTYPFIYPSMHQLQPTIVETSLLATDSRFQQAFVTQDYKKIDE